jgi:hypothetical protein
MRLHQFFAAPAGGADDDQLAFGAQRRRQRQVGLQQALDVLARLQRADKQEVAGAGRTAPAWRARFGGWRVEPLGRARRGHHADPALVDAEAFDQLAIA